MSHVRSVLVVTHSRMLADQIELGGKIELHVVFLEKTSSLVFF